MRKLDAAERRQRFEAVYLAARDPLVRYLARRAAPDAVEDLFADVMAVAWQRVDAVPVGAEIPWMLGVARKVLGNHRRAAGRFGRLLDRLGMAGPRGIDPGVAPQPVGDPDLAAALASLSVADAEILRLSAWEELKPREIAAVLGISANAATVRLHRARARLRVALERIAPQAGKDRAVDGHAVGVKRKEAAR
jgi:RNA polymerase sigma-70 factor (ECF subfamily)